MAKKDLYVVMGAMTKCSQGTIPLPLRVTSQMTKDIGGKLVATVQDNIPAVNVGMYGICKILTKTNPMPCVCATVSPWKGGYDKEKISGKKPLLGTSTLKCTVGGTISLTSTGQKKEDIKSKEVRCSVCKKRHPQDMRPMGTNLRGDVVSFAFGAINKSKGLKGKSKITSQNHLFYRELDKDKVNKLKSVLSSLKKKLEAAGGTGKSIGDDVHKQRKVFMLIPDSVQVHHLISVEAVGGTEDKFDPEWHAICYRHSYDINCAQNSVILPSDLLSACHFKVPLHKGNHNNTSIKGSELAVHINYVSKVFNEVRRIKQQYINETKPCEDIDKGEILDFHQDMLDISDTIFDNIKNFLWTITADGFHYSNGSHIGCLDYCKSIESKERVLAQKYNLTPNQSKGGLKGLFFNIMESLDNVANGCPSKRVHSAEGCKNKPANYWTYARYDKMPTEEELGLKLN